MLLLCGPGPRAAADDDLRAVEASLFEQGLEPGLELLVEVVDEDGTCRSDRRNIGSGRLVQLTVAARPNQSFDLETIAADIREHVANDAECGDHGNAVRGVHRCHRQH